MNNDMALPTSFNRIHYCPLSIYALVYLNLYPTNANTSCTKESNILGLCCTLSFLFYFLGTFIELKRLETVFI